MLHLVETEEYADWLDSMRDRMVKARIMKQMQRVQNAGCYVGDWKSVGEGVFENRIDVGPGYRVYSAIEGSVVLLLLVGGDKSSQRRDILRAQAMLKEWREAHWGGVWQ